MAGAGRRAMARLLSTLTGSRMSSSSKSIMVRVIGEARQSRSVLVFRVVSCIVMLLRRHRSRLLLVESARYVSVASES